MDLSASTDCTNLNLRKLSISTIGRVPVYAEIKLIVSVLLTWKVLSMTRDQQHFSMLHNDLEIGTASRRRMGQQKLLTRCIVTVSETVFTFIVKLCTLGLTLEPASGLTT